MNDQFSSTHRRMATVGMCIVGAAALFACGGGSDATSGGEASATRMSALSARVPAPPPFVPLAEPLPPDATEYDKHIQIARIGGPDNDGMYPEFCISGGQNPALQNRNVVPITKLFDDLYFVGTYSVGVFVLKTQDGGYILFDTMNNATDVNNIIVPQLQSAGIDPATLRGIVVTHGHGDHDGGALRLQTLYHTSTNPVTTVVGSADYIATKTYAATVKVDSTQPGVPVPITIGGTTFTAMSTPGHTQGTTSFFIPVTFAGKKHYVAYQGGSAFPGNAAAALQYLRSTERMYEQAKVLNAEASINSHTFFDKSIDRITKIQSEGFGNGNPMIQTNAKILLSFATLRSCSAALQAQRDSTARNPVWHPTRTELYDARATGNVIHVGARVSNYFNVLSGGAVTFRSAQGDSCVATTDEKGIAACLIKSRSIPAATPGLVTATFEGLASESAVELSSTDARASD